MDNIEKSKLIIKVLENIKNEEKFVNVVDTMIKRRPLDNDYLRVTFEDGNSTACVSVTMDIEDELAVILGIHRNRLDKCKEQLDDLLNGEYNRLVEHNKTCRNTSDKENPYV